MVDLVLINDLPQRRMEMEMVWEEGQLLPFFHRDTMFQQVDVGGEHAEGQNRERKV